MCKYCFFFWDDKNITDYWITQSPENTVNIKITTGTAPPCMTVCQRLECGNTHFLGSKARNPQIDYTNSHSRRCERPLHMPRIAMLARPRSLSHFDPSPPGVPFGRCDTQRVVAILPARHSVFLVWLWNNKSPPIATTMESHAQGSKRVHPDEFSENWDPSTKLELRYLFLCFARESSGFAVWKCRV